MPVIRDVDGLIAALCKSECRIGVKLYPVTTYGRIRATVPDFVVEEPELPLNLDAAYERVIQFATDAAGDFSNPIHGDLADIHAALMRKEPEPEVSQGEKE